MDPIVRNSQGIGGSQTLHPNLTSYNATRGADGESRWLPSPAWDEMVNGSGGIRGPWQRLLASLLSLPHTGLSERAERTRLQLHESGVTYNAYDADGSAQRPWALDPVPLVIAADEWARIESGIRQRAKLLNLILRDLYGPQTLLRDGHYPPGLVYANPEFLRPTRRMMSGGNATHLHFYAADLVRTPDGIWRVCSDRLQAPTGAGYALENRRILQRTMPEVLRNVGARPIRPFFERWQSALQGFGRSDNPRIVLLTPGPLNEAYFEHVYLARELGATLVEGADLTVRGETVYLKSLEGLQRVDVIIRRVDSAFSDPLELRPDSALGIVGLMEAVRSGNVIVANPPGSGLLETPAVMAFLPGLAQRLLEGDLELPSIATWWCGQTYARDQVLSLLQGLVIRPAFATSSDPINASSLTDSEKHSLITRLNENPSAFVAQERVTASTAPGFSPQGLIPQSIILRVFATADGEDYAVMPGGLARVISGDEPLLGSIQRGGVSKDVLITTDDPTPVIVSAPSRRRRISIRRSGGELQSRVADNLYWFGRYAERFDCSVRVLRSAATRLVSNLGARQMLELSTLARILERSAIIDHATASAPPDSSMLHGAIVAIGAPGQAIHGILENLQRLAASVRDRFSLDMWKAVSHLTDTSRLALGVSRKSGIGISGSEAARLLQGSDTVIRLSAAVAGMASENMTRGLGWRFLDLGRRIERGIHIGRCISSSMESWHSGNDIALRLSLELCDSTITYRTRYLAALQAAPTLDLVLSDESSPRSLAFQFDAIARNIAALPERGEHSLSFEPTAITGGIQKIITDLEASAETTTTIRDLCTLLKRSESELMTLSDAIKRAYFTHVLPQVSYGMGMR